MTNIKWINDNGDGWWWSELRCKFNNWSKSDPFVHWFRLFVANIYGESINVSSSKVNWLHWLNWFSKDLNGEEEKKLKRIKIKYCKYGIETISITFRWIWYIRLVNLSSAHFAISRSISIFANKNWKKPTKKTKIT